MNDARTYVENYLSSTLLEFQHKGLGEAVTELSVWEKVLIYKYSLDGYESLNEALRAGKPHRMEGVLNEALQKLPDYQNVVHRGTELTASQKAFYQRAFEEQLMIVEPAFLSCSTSRTLANMFSRGNTLFRIDSLHGKSIEHLAFYGTGSGQNEWEILFGSQTGFIVTGYQTFPDLTQITLLEIEKT